MSRPPLDSGLSRARSAEVNFSVRSCGPSPVWLAEFPKDVLLKDHGGPWYPHPYGHLSPPLGFHRDRVWCDRCRYIVGDSA